MLDPREGPDGEGGSLASTTAENAGWQRCSSGWFFISFLYFLNFSRFLSYACITFILRKEHR